MWVGTLGGGLNRIGADGRVTRYRSGPAGSPTHDWIWALASDDRTLWIGTGLSLDAVDLDQPSRVRRVALNAGQDPHNPEGAQGLAQVRDHHRVNPELVEGVDLGGGGDGDECVCVCVSE